MELNFDPYSIFKVNAIAEDFEPLIENFLNRKEFMLIHATAKTGKSMLALNIGLAISSGTDFLGMATNKSKVLYLQTEIADYALKDRIELMLKVFGDEDKSAISEKFFISKDRIRIDLTEGLNLIKDQIIKLEPSLLIIDPLYELHRKNEDNATEMAPLLSELRNLARTCNCAVVLIHHQGKKGENYAGNAGHACRGSSAFADVPDVSISLSKSNQDYYLRGICRNRPPIEDIKIKFNEDNFHFELSNNSAKPKRTKDLILEILRLYPQGLMKKDIEKELKLGNKSISSSAITKQLSDLKDNHFITARGSFKGTYFSIQNIEEEKNLLEEKFPPQLDESLSRAGVYP